ncbi:MAG: hypothetical protein P4L74_02310 [Candidatus Doudnabacteria bacterium]|nr:hypothetical protein [Candidatus Doudnabacteria bacterium]
MLPEDFYEENATWFTATQGTRKAALAINLDKLYEAEPNRYPGRLENIKLAKELTPRVVALKLLFETEGKPALHKIAAFCQAWQQDTNGEQAANEIGEGEEEREFGRRSYECYLKGIRWAQKDFPNLGGVFSIGPVSYSRTLSDLMTAVDQIVVGQFRKHPSVRKLIQKG